MISILHIIKKWRWQHGQLNMKLMMVGLILLLCNGCATILTADPAYGKVPISYMGNKSYCKEIPRVYSGVMHNLCMLYGEPGPHVNSGARPGAVTYILFDTALSFAADTIIIPYTATQQARKGNIKVN